MILFDKLYLNIGAMKAGTTWLYRQLEQHPDILFSPEKELHYHAARAGDRRALNLRYRLTRARNALQRVSGGWSSSEGREALRWYAPYVLMPPGNRNWYRRRFPVHMPEHQYCADFSNLTARIGESGWREIRGLAATLRLSYVLRHPLDRVWSHLKFLSQLGTHQAQAGAMTVRDIETLAGRYDLWRHSQYSLTLASLRQHFEAHEVKILFYDDIAARPEGVLRELEAFLDIAPHTYTVDKLTRRINTSADIGIPGVLWDVYEGPLQRELAALEDLGLALPSGWRDAPG